MYNTITVFVHNARSLSKHRDDTVSDDRVINNKVIGFTETQINPSDSTSEIMETLDFLAIRFIQRPTPGPIILRSGLSPWPPTLRFC